MKHRKSIDKNHNTTYPGDLVLDCGSRRVMSMLIFDDDKDIEDLPLCYDIDFLLHNYGLRSLALPDPHIKVFETKNLAKKHSSA